MGLLTAALFASVDELSSSMAEVMTPLKLRKYFGHEKCLTMFGRNTMRLSMSGVRIIAANYCPCAASVLVQPSSKKKAQVLET